MAFFELRVSHAAGVLFLTCVACASACGGTTDSVPTGTPPAGTAPPGTQPAPSCDASSTADVEVSSDDLNGFPPYAASGCTLVYVSSAGALVARDLASRAETVLAPATDHPRRPTASADVIAWEADFQSASVVRVRVGQNAPTTITGSFVSAGEPRASGGFVSFTAWTSASSAGDTDVWLYDAKTGEARVVIGGPGQQRFSDVSSKYVVASDFSEEGPEGRFDNDGRDLSDIVVFDRATGAVTTRRLDGKQAFPMLADGDVLAYLSWSGIHPEPKLTAYELFGGPVFGDPRADKPIAQVKYLSSDYARPAAVGGTIEWIANPDGRTTLYRAPADGSAPPTAVPGLEDFRLFAPAPSASGFTVVATNRVGSTEVIPRLRAVPR